MNSYVHKVWNPEKNEVWSAMCVGPKHKEAWDEVANSIKSMMLLSRLDYAYEAGQR